METGLILPIPEAEPIVADIRKRRDPNAALGVPAHVTALYPFRPYERIGDEVKDRLGELLAKTPAFEVSFARVGRFPGVCWLAPEPRAPFDALTRSLVETFSDCVPYGGRFGDPTPHLTIAVNGNEGVLDRIERRMRARLAVPLRVRIDTCALMALANGAWMERLRFPLGR